LVRWWSYFNTIYLLIYTVLSIVKITIMSKVKEPGGKSGKKAPEKNLKEKRTAKAAKGEGKNKESTFDFNVILGGRQA